MPSAKPTSAANPLALAQRLLAISEDMLRQAGDDNDDGDELEPRLAALEALDRERQTLLEQLSAIAVPSHQVAAVGACLRRAVAANDDLLERGRRRKRWLEGELRGFSAGRRAHSAYTSVDRAE